MAPATEISPQAQRWFAIGGLAWLLAATAWLSAWRDDHAILINTTESLPNWAFFIDKHRRPQRGDFVVFTPPVTSRAMLVGVPPAKVLRHDNSRLDPLAAPSSWAGADGAAGTPAKT